MLWYWPSTCGELAGPVKADTKDPLREQFNASVRLGRMGLAEEVTSAALFLLQTKAVTLQALTCVLTGGLGSV